MMSDASDMLAAALEQMDGIIAGKVGLLLSPAQNKALTPSVPIECALVSHISSGFRRSLFD